MLGEYQRDEALIHFQRGLVLERANRIEEAVEEYRRAVAHNPHLAEAHSALGLYYRRQGLLAKAADEFRTVANLADNFPAHFSLSGVLAELGRYDEALAGLRRCLEFAPGDATAHYEIAVIQFQRGDYRAALAHLELAAPYFQDDWKVHHMLGSCHLRLCAYDESQAALEAALRLAGHSAAKLYVADRLRALARHREVGRPRGLKDQLYAERGVALLGSAQDDGLSVHECQDYYFTYPDVAATVGRLHAMAEGCGWGIGCVVAADRLAQPLAEALADALGVPQRRADEVRRGERALVMLAVGREAELLQLIAKRVLGPTITFCLGLNWLRHSDALPDVSGIVARAACGVPWEAELRRLRASGAPALAVEDCLARAAAEIAVALAEAGPEPSIAEQVRYYRERRGLRFIDRSMIERPAQ
ncbi:MAG: hypothetical protein RLZZ387_3259 [Chloroflexota bacterium]|jgi:tetratricopeptide (TPR) repeat protein